MFILGFINIIDLIWDADLLRTSPKLRVKEPKKHRYAYI